MSNPKFRNAVAEKLRRDADPDAADRRILRECAILNFCACCAAVALLAFVALALYCAFTSNPYHQ